MQPVNFAVAEPEAGAAEPEAGAAGLEAVEAGVVLLPHAAISRVAAPAANVAIKVVRLTVFPPQDQIADAQA
jgi:hypothetical protein